MKYVFTLFATFMPLITPPSAHPVDFPLNQYFAVSKPNSRNDHIETVISNEGGYQNCRYDRANRGIGTKFGITPATYKKYKGKLPTVSQMKAMRKEVAFDIYVRIWQDSGMDLLPEDIAGDVFDAFVNTPYTSLQILERITGIHTCAERFRIDEATAIALRSMPSEGFRRQFKEARKQYYMFRAANHTKSDWQNFYRKIGKTGSPNNARYLTGWLKRLDESL